jgi:hypothetical protein
MKYFIFFINYINWINNKYKVKWMNTSFLKIVEWNNGLIIDITLFWFYELWISLIIIKVSYFFMKMVIWTMKSWRKSFGWRKIRWILTQSLVNIRSLIIAIYLWRWRSNISFWGTLQKFKFTSFNKFRMRKICRALETRKCYRILFCYSFS